jgi:hypothetical protein
MVLRSDHSLPVPPLEPEVDPGVPLEGSVVELVGVVDAPGEGVGEMEASHDGTLDGRGGGVDCAGCAGAALAGGVVGCTDAGGCVDAVGGVDAGCGDAGGCDANGGGCEANAGGCEEKDGSGLGAACAAGGDDGMRGRGAVDAGAIEGWAEGRGSSAGF